MDFGPGGRYAISSGFDNSLIIWDIKNREPIRYLFHEGVVEEERGPSVVIAPDGQSALSAGPDNQILKWRLKEPGLLDLIDWIQINRYLGELSCDQRQSYKIEPLCGDGVDMGADSMDLLVSAQRYSSESQSEQVSTISDSNAEFKLVEPAVELPRPIHELKLGESQGQLQPQDFDVWVYSSPGGEIMNIQLLADQPRNSKSALIDGRLEPGQLDTFLLITAPDGIPIAANDDWISSDNEWSSNATIENLPFTFPGDYRIEARSYMDLGAGGYTLTVHTDPYVPDNSLFQDYTGVYSASAIGSDFSIVVDDEKLYIETRWLSGYSLPILKIRMLPAYDDMFVAGLELPQFSPIELVFLRDEADSIVGLKMDPCLTTAWEPGQCWANRVGD